MTDDESFELPAASVGRAAVGGDGECRVVRLAGDHDMATVSALTATLSEAVAADDADVVVDVRGVTFMDASTIGVIVRARQLLALQSR